MLLTEVKNILILINIHAESFHIHTFVSAECMTDVCKESKLLPVLSSLLEDGEVLIEVQSGVLGLLRALANSSKSDG